MIYFGTCHSTSDILIYVPEMSILFTGDLFSDYGRPGRDESLVPDTARIIKAVHWIENRMTHIDKIITGHGKILAIDDLKSFNTAILKTVSEK